MKVQRKAPNLPAALRPSRTATRAARSSLRPAPEARSPRATRRAPRCDGNRRRSHLLQAPGRPPARRGQVTPPIGLSLPSMLGTRPNRTRPAGRGLLLVSSLLALLALAVSPVSAFAADSSGQQYEDALPTATGGKKSPKNEAPA